MKKMISTIAKTMATMNSDNGGSDEDDGEEGVLTTRMVTVMMATATKMIIPKA